MKTIKIKTTQGYIIWFLVCIAILLPIHLTWADTEVSGNITADTTWTKANSPYVISSTVQVLEGVTLTIEPDVQVRFNQDTYLSIDGKLIARGFADNPIMFTSNMMSPNPGDWGAIRFLDRSVDAAVDANGNYVDGSIIEFSIIEYGGKHPNDITYRGGVLQLRNASPYITRNIVRNNDAHHNYGGGIFLERSNAYIVSNEIMDNSAGCGGGIYITWDSSPSIIDNIIINNSAVWSGGGISIRNSSPTPFIL